MGKEFIVKNLCEVDSELIKWMCPDVEIIEEDKKKSGSYLKPKGFEPNPDTHFIPTLDIDGDNSPIKTRRPAIGKKSNLKHIDKNK